MSINDILFIIPKGFKTDLASIPRIFWSITPPTENKLVLPAILHDFLYRNPCFYSRKEADLIFYHALRYNGVSLSKAALMYYVVRFFGWPHYG